MDQRLVADVCPGETRVALLEDDSLAEIHLETQGKERLVGNIYKGRVANILPGMQAAFIDIGLDKNAFLYAGDILTDEEAVQDAEGTVNSAGRRRADTPQIRKILHPNQEILVQVLKQPGGAKGARVTTHITLPGRLLVLTPTVDHIGISKRIESEEERERLRAAVNRARQPGMGVILRTAAEHASEQELEREIRFYSRLWDRIRSKASVLSAPRLVYAEQNLLFRSVRDAFTDDVTEFVVNDQAAYERIRALVSILAPWMLPRVRYYTDDAPIFDYYNVEPQIARAEQQRVGLKNGSYLVFDEAEALTAIDVNTGKFIGKNDLQETILATNLQAADEIARQIRLRDLSGIIIIDFIDMDIPENKRKVVDRLEQAVKRDRTKTNVLGMTQLGLVEMTRKRLRRPLSAMIQTVCPTCGGSGRVKNVESMARQVRLAVMRLMESEESGSFLVEVAPAVARHILAMNSHGQHLLPDYKNVKFYIRGAHAAEPEHLEISTVGRKHMLDGAEKFC